MDDSHEDQMSPPKKARAGDSATDKTQSSIGKRLHRASNKFNSNISNRLMDDPLSMTPFSQDAMQAGGLDPKPFRSVIKRYWTEEEVRVTWVTTCRTRN